MMEVSAGARQADWESRPDSAVPIQMAGPTAVVTKRWDVETGETVTGTAASTHERGKNQISVVAQRAAALRLQMAHTARGVGMGGGGGSRKIQPRQKYGW